MSHTIDGQSYDLIKEIGRGSSSRVYLAHRLSDKENVSLKIISSSSTINIKGEVLIHRLLSLKSNQGIVKFIAADMLKGLIVTEYCQRGSLSQHLSCSGGVLCEMEARAYLSSIAAGLACMHYHGFIHRDIKLSNILLTTDCTEAKLADFGLSIAEEDLLADPYPMKCGTPAYLAPEIQLAGKTRYSYPIDMWSFGVVAYKLLTGDFPVFPLPIKKLAGSLSEDAISFLVSLLVEDPCSRASIAELQQHAFLCSYSLLNIFSMSQLQKIQSKTLPDIDFAPLSSVGFASITKTYKTPLGQLTLGKSASSCQHWKQFPLSTSSLSSYRTSNPSIFLSFENFVFEVNQKMELSIWINGEVKAVWKKSILPAPFAPVFYYIYRVILKILSKTPKAIMLLEGGLISGILMSNGPSEDFLFQNEKLGSHQIYRIVPKMAKIFVYHEAYDGESPNISLAIAAKSSVMKRSQIVIRGRPTKIISIESSMSFQPAHLQDLCNISAALNLHAKALRLVLKSKETNSYPLIFTSSSPLSNFFNPIEKLNKREKSLPSFLLNSISDSGSGFSATSIRSAKSIQSTTSSSPYITGCTRDQNGVIHVSFSDDCSIYIILEHSLCWHMGLPSWTTTKSPLLCEDIKTKLQIFSQNLCTFQQTVVQ